MGDEPMGAPVDWAAMTPKEKAKWFWVSILSEKRTQWVDFLESVLSGHKLGEDDVTAMVMEKNELVRELAELRKQLQKARQ